LKGKREEEEEKKVQLSQTGQPIATRATPRER
jgi:hypothetical protein